MNPGDFVKHKTGGPVMNLTSYNRKENGWNCSWWNDHAGKFETATYPETSLVPTDAPKEETDADRAEQLRKLGQDLNG